MSAESEVRRQCTLNTWLFEVFSHSTLTFRVQHNYRCFYEEQFMLTEWSTNVLSIFTLVLCKKWCCSTGWGRNAFQVVPLIRFFFCSKNPGTFNQGASECPSMHLSVKGLGSMPILRKEKYTNVRHYNLNLHELCVRITWCIHNSETYSRSLIRNTA